MFEMCGIILPMDNKRKFDSNYIKVFLIAGMIFSLCAIISIVFSQGVWVYYGDFNVQQIPFYYHAHEAIRNGEFFYDWYTDLGGSLVGCYSFYLLGSPFFWLTIPFPNEAVPYLMPWLTTLKYAIMALTAFMYLKRHTKTSDGAFIGALLYAFSGYQGAVLVYNHFHDVLAFFPLYLLLFEKMVEERKRFGFIVMTGLMAINNYYFFVGEVVFLIIYFVTMYCFEGDTLRELLNKFLRALLCGSTGVLLMGVYLLPAVYYTMHNSRLSKTLSGYDLVAYSEPVMLWGMLKNIFMLPDVSGLNSAFNTNYSRVSGIGGYLPLFSMAGVIAFFLYNKEKNREKRLLLTCLAFSVIPVLNSMFSAFNSEYYARWYYMPILICAGITGRMLEGGDETLPSIKKGAKIVAIVTGVILIACLLPAKTDSGDLTVIGALKNYEQLISETVFSVLMLVYLFFYLYKIPKRIRITKTVVVLACFATAVTMFVTGSVLIENERKNSFVTQAVKGESPLKGLDDGFYRVETDEDIYNYPMLWREHSITSFISTIPSSTIDFYASQGMSRKVTSNLWASRLGARTLLSGKYFIKDKGIAIEHIGRVDDMADVKQYELLDTINDFEIYENTCFVPMGFCFDTYVTESEYEENEANSQTKDRILLSSLILSDEVAAEYGYLMEHKEAKTYSAISLNTFMRSCEERRKTACENFTATTNGFTADIDMEKDNLVFFSVPIEDGFTAYVDGKETEIVKVDYSFMAVMVPKGRHKIEFKYVPSNLKLGMLASAAGVVLFFISVVFTILDIIKRKKEKELLDYTDSLC